MPGHRAGDRRGASGARGAVIGKLSAHVPHLLLAALCAGIASANAVRVQTAIVPLLAVGLGTLAAVLPRARFALLAIGLALAGSWLGALRLDAIDRSPMSAEIGRAAVARVTVTGPARRTQFALRIPGRIERFGDRDVREPVLLQLPVGRSPPQGSILELPVLVAEPRSERGRLRRAHVAPASRRPRGPAGPRSRGRRSAGRPRRSRRPAPLCDRRRARVGRLRRAACRAARDRARGGRRARRRPAGRLPGIGALPPARRLGPERRARRGRRAARRVAARDPAHGGPGRRARRHRRVRARRRRATVGRTGRSRGRARVPRVDVRSRTGSLVVPPPRRARLARVEPVQPARSRLPALVRGRRGDLHARAAPDAPAGGISAAPRGGGRRRRVDRVRSCDGADPPLPVRLGSRLLGDRERDGGARRRAAAGARPARGGGPPDRPGRRCATRLAGRLARRVSRALCPRGRVASARAALGSARTAGGGGIGGRHRSRPGDRERSPWPSPRPGSSRSPGGRRQIRCCRHRQGCA